MRNSSIVDPKIRVSTGDGARKGTKDLSVNVQDLRVSIVSERTRGQWSAVERKRCQWRTFD